MDKNRKLRRYGRKDYTLVVDFPVEIVGRDGVVRRYTFEESVRLYQRRIASANLRYADMDVASAEVAHCQRRIEQLRRSYFTRYGWSSLHSALTPGPIEEGLAGEVAAFLRRALDGGETDPEACRLSILTQGGEPRAYYVQGAVDSALEAEREGCLLYLYRFTAPERCEVRESFYGFLRVLMGVRHAREGVEVLLAWHETADCGLVLTGKRGAALAADTGEGGELPGLDLAWMEGGGRPDPLRDALSLLRQGRRLDALDQFIAAYEDQPFRRPAYFGVAVVAEHLGEHAEAETAALMGSRYFPDDPVMQLHLAIAVLRRGVGDPEEPLQRVESLEGPTASSQLVGALAALSRSEQSLGLRRLARAWSLASSRDPDLLGALRTLKPILAGWLGLQALGAVVTGVGLGLALWLAPPLIGVSAAGVGVAALGRLGLRRSVLRLLRDPGLTGLRLTSARALYGVFEVPPSAV